MSHRWRRCLETLLSLSGRVLSEATKVANDMGISHTTFQLEVRAEDVDFNALQVGNVCLP